jgi:hypothetical protein
MAPIAPSASKGLTRTAAKREQESSTNYTPKISPRSRTISSRVTKRPAQKLSPTTRRPRRVGKGKHKRKAPPTRTPPATPKASKNNGEDPDDEEYDQADDFKAARNDKHHWYPLVLPIPYYRLS